MTRGPVPSELPTALRDTGFRVSDARQLGVPSARLRARDLSRTVYGVRASAPPSGLVDRCRLFAMRLPASAVVSHTTAALLLGAPLPPGLERDPRLHFTVPAGQRAPHAAGLIGHSRVVRDGDVIERDGLRMSSPARVWCELSRALEIPDLVAVGDFLIHHRLPLTRPAQLRDIAERGDRIGHVGATREALPLLDSRSESRPESLLRVILARGRLPAPQINHVVVATDAGRDRRTDLAYPALQFAIEYQGDYHRTQAQWRLDMSRRMRLEAQAWYILEVNADDLRDPAALCALVASILARRSHR